MLKSLNPSLASGISVYDGPQDLANWTLQNSDHNTWRLKNGALYTSTAYMIGRPIEPMPDMANIAFDVSWQTGYPQFIFSFYGDNVNSYSGNSYSLHVSHNNVQLYRYSNKHGSQQIGQATFQELQTLRKASFRVLADRNKRSFTVLINGQITIQCTDSIEVPGLGNHIVIYPRGNVRMKFANIRISEWDGAIPKNDSGAELELKEDTILFVNNDKVSGHLETIKDGQASFKTSYATLNVPLEQAVKIRMSTETNERARRYKNDLRAHFADEGTVTVDLSSIKDGKIAGNSENFGSIEIPLCAFSRLNFNIYRQTDASENDEWDF
jgi:hypothetical protein